MINKVVAGAFGIGLLLAPLVTSGAQAGTAPAYRCKNQTLGTTTITGDIVVPSGAFCDLNGTHVTGSAEVEPKGGLALDLSAAIDGRVSVEPNGQFAARGSSTVGDVKCSHCAVADLNGSTVKGSLVDDGLTQGIFITNSTVNGDLTVLESRDSGFGFSITGSFVGDDLTFNDNKGTSTISSNVIVNELRCEDNQPPPTGSNLAGSKSGQCATL
jgi:hypothetical protein